ncbi:MAG: PilZ domain-containing protein [Magnetococcales bacterium]|nr:PilZ domain-containing protein [Magnetococcales bacterium]
MNDNTNANPQDRRHFSRVEFSHDVELTTGKGGRIAGAFTDISLRGMLFQADKLPKKGTHISGTLNLGDVSLNIAGEVVASHPNRGAAIRFQDLDIDTFAHLRRLVSLNLGDSETIDREFFTSL